MSAWRLTCLLCRAGERGYTTESHKAMQEHLVTEHLLPLGYTPGEAEALRRDQEGRPEGDGYVFNLPDGTDWLQMEPAPGRAAPVGHYRPTTSCQPAHRNRLTARL